MKIVRPSAEIVRRALLVFVGAAVVIAASLLLAPRGEKDDAPHGPAFMRYVPAPDVDSPYAVIASKGESFPDDVMSALLGGASSLAGRSASAPFVPIVKRADESLVVCALRGGVMRVYGAFSLRGDEAASLSSRRLPASWRRELGTSELEHSGGRSAVSTGGGTVFIELDLEEGVAYIADDAADMDRIALARDGETIGISIPLEGYGEGGCAQISDGGMLASLFGVEPARVVIDAEWRHTAEDGAHEMSDMTPHVTAEWRARGLDAVFGGEFMKSLKPRDWTRDPMFVPDPLIAAFGIDLPDPGRRTSALPFPLRLASSQLERLGLTQRDIRALLKGPSAFSLGGRTQVLWFDLPGVALDLHGRGTASRRLVDGFWKNTFFGVTPSPLDEWDAGGAIDLPFTMMAAASKGRSVIGLIAPDAELSDEIADVMSREGKCAAWLYADLPKLGIAMSEMPTFNAILNGEEGLPMEDDATALVRETMTRLGRVVITLDRSDHGRALWYDR